MTFAATILFDLEATNAAAQLLLFGVRPIAVVYSGFFTGEVSTVATAVAFFEVSLRILHFLNFGHVMPLKLCEIEPLMGLLDIE